MKEQTHVTKRLTLIGIHSLKGCFESHPARTKIGKSPQVNQRFSVILWVNHYHETQFIIHPLDGDKLSGKQLVIPDERKIESQLQAVKC